MCWSHVQSAPVPRLFISHASRYLGAGVRVVEVTLGVPAPSLLAISIEGQLSSLELRLGSGGFATTWDFACYWPPTTTTKTPSVPNEQVR